MTPTQPMVQVVWRDAFHEFDVSDIEDLRDEYEVHTIGFLLAEDDKWVTIAQEILPDGNGYRGVSRIPQKIVIRLRQLKSLG